MFQSTRPARGATWLRYSAALASLSFQSTRPARGATPPNRLPQPAARVSIHAPRAGRDTNRWRRSAGPSRFQSTRPARGATCGTMPRGGFTCRFKPRAPRGARLNSAPWERLNLMFQSTRPARGATLIFWYTLIRPSVSIHAPRAGRDSPTLSHSARKPHTTLSAHPPLPNLTIHPLPSPPPAHLPLPTPPNPSPRTSPHSPARSTSARYTTSGPCGSYDGFAPTCSTRLFQLSPKK